MTWKNASPFSSLFVFLLVTVVLAIRGSAGSPEAVSIGAGNSPWMWMSAEGRPDEGDARSHLLEVVEVIGEPHSVASSVGRKSEPRFIGHLKRKLCRVGLGVGCGSGKEKERFPIDTQDINYVQPLVIQAIGKPIPAIPAETKKGNTRKDIEDSPKSDKQNNLEGYHIFKNKFASHGNLYPKPGLSPLLNNALVPSSFGLTGSETGYSPVFTSPGLNPSNFGGHSPHVPPPAVFKSTPHQLLRGGGESPPNPYLAVGSSIQTNTFAPSPFSMESILAQQPSLNTHIATSTNTFITPTPGVFKASLVNSLQKVNNFQLPFNNIHQSHSSTPNFGMFQNVQNRPHQSHISLNHGPPTRPLHLSPDATIANLLSNNIRSQPQIIKLSQPQLPQLPKIKIVNITTRPKKDVSHPSTSFVTTSKTLDENGEKVIKHIHVHKHIHQMDTDTSPKIVNKVRDNLDAFSTSVFRATNPKFEIKNSLRSFVNSSHRSKKRQRNIDSVTNDNAFVNLVRTSLGSCTCVPKQDCPAEFVAAFDKREGKDSSFIQDPRNRPLFSISNKIPSFSMESRTVPKNEKKKVSLKQIIKPRKKNTKLQDYLEPEQKERKILLNIKRLTKRDLDKDDDKKHFPKTGTKKTKTPFFNQIAKPTKNREERKILLNLKRVNKRDISHVFSKQMDFQPLSRQEKRPPLCVDEKSSSRLNRVKRSPQFIRISDDQHDRDGHDNSGTSTQKVDEREDTNLHEGPEPKFIKSVGNILSKLPFEISLKIPPDSTASHLSLSPHTSATPGIHSLLHQFPGVQDPLVTPPHLLFPHPLAISPFLPSLHHTFSTETTLQKLEHLSNQVPPLIPNLGMGSEVNLGFTPTFPHQTGITPLLPPVPTGSVSLYLNHLPDFINKVIDNRKGHPILTDLHDKRIHYLTQYQPNGRPRTTNACYFINCRELSFYCPPPTKNRRHSRQDERRQFNFNELPFTCGLYEVCCNLDSFHSPVEHVGVSLPPPVPSNPRTCGRSTVSTIKSRITSDLIDQGEARFGEFPWQAAILKKEGKDNVYVCAGSLIDRSHILTAAHCIEGYSADHLRIRLGEWDVNRDSEFYSHLEYDAIGVAVHPDFYSGNLINDVAIVRILYPVDLNKTPHISPICLPKPGLSFAGSRCWVSGWGKNTFGKKGKYQNLLKKVDVPIVSKRACETILRETRLGTDYTLHHGMMCAGGEPEKDACKGDGGGPLSCRDIDGRFVLSGIVSWGIGCGQPGIPGVYVNVEYYVGWIRQMISS